MPFLSKATLARLEKKFGGHPVDLVVLVLFKGIWGLVEITGGLLLLVLTQAYAHSSLATRIAAAVRQELVEDPQDSFVHYYTVVTQHVTLRGAIYLGYFIILLGIIKCATAAALWSRSHTARLIGLIFFGGVGVYGVYRLWTQFSMPTFGAWIIDMAVAYYFWKIYPKHLPERKKK